MKKYFLAPLALFALILAGAGCALTTDFSQLVDFSFDVPESAVVNESFDVAVSLTNLDSEPHTLLDLEVGDEFLSTISLDGAVPEYSDSYHLPVWSLMFYNYEKEILPGESFDVVMKFTPTEVGTFSDQFNACVDSEGNCIEKSISIEVTE